MPVSVLLGTVALSEGVLEQWAGSEIQSLMSERWVGLSERMLSGVALHGRPDLLPG